MLFTTPQELSDISVEDRRQKLDNSSMELQTAETAIDSNKARMEGIYRSICSLWVFYNSSQWWKNGGILLEEMWFQIWYY